MCASEKNNAEERGGGQKPSRESVAGDNPSGSTARQGAHFSLGLLLSFASYGGGVSSAEQ